MRVVEAFSGIGSQSKALSNIGVEFEVLATIEWDINAIYAYDIIHNGPQDLREFENFTKEELVRILNEFSLSSNGKDPMKKTTLNRYPLDALKRIYCAIKRTKNLVSIKDVNADDLPENIDLFTYSFPCQDLSLSGSWHGNTLGIDRDANTRSGLLWEVERILQQYNETGRQKPKFLLMENVSNILSKRHIGNFEEWKEFLSQSGYVNQVYTLSANNFGVPQSRKRTFMVSVLAENNEQLRMKIEEYFLNNNLENKQVRQLEKLSNYLKTDYTNKDYLREALLSTPNYTKSRKKIEKENDHLYSDGKVLKSCVRTITTKQDRHPNSGVIMMPNSPDGKSPFRYLTPRESFMLMGFEEEDYQRLIDNNFKFNKGRKFYGVEKLNMLAGNSIVVNVLEEIFLQIEEIRHLFNIM